MRTLLLVCVVGCTSTDSEEAVICTANDPAVFTQLTDQRWGACDSNNGLCLQLAADGTYRAVTGYDDYAISDSGLWSFVARDATSGLACFDNGSVIDFALTPDGLRWDGAMLPAFESLAIVGSRAALAVIPASPVFLDLTEHPWAKTNDFDLDLAPTSFSLHRDGTFTGSFRHGASSVNGTFSVVYDNRGDVEFHPRSTPSIAASNDVPHFDDNGLLRFYAASYRDAAIKTDEQSLAYSAYAGDAGLVVTATWRGALLPNATSTWELTLRNPTAREQTITSIQIMLAVFDGQTVLVDRTLQEVVAPGAAYTTTVDVAFAAGPQALLIDVRSFDTRQPYTNYRSFFVEL